MTNKPFIILLWGAPAAGKSTLARSLANEYLRRADHTLPHLGTDKLNQSVIGQRFEGRIRTRLYDCIFTLAEGLLKAEQPVMLEGTFLNRRLRDQVGALAEKAGVKLISVQVECRLALREARNGTRRESDHVPEEFLRQAHALAKEQIATADFVFDTELHDPDRLAEFLMGAVGVCDMSGVGR